MDVLYFKSSVVGRLGSILFSDAAASGRLGLRHPTKALPSCLRPKKTFTRITSSSVGHASANPLYFDDHSTCPKPAHLNPKLLNPKPLKP